MSINNITIIRKQIKVHKLSFEDNKIAWLCSYKGMCGNKVEYGMLS